MALKSAVPTSIISGLATGLVILSTLPASAEKMPRGAFLLYPAPTEAALVHQVDTTPRVSKRYARLFGASQQQIHGVFHHLRPVRLTRDTPLDVYYVRPGEHYGYKRRIIKRGTIVYVNAQGQPLLMQVCGNPIRSGIVTAFHPKASAPSEQLALASPLPEFESEGAPVGLLRSAVPGTDISETQVPPVVLAATTSARHIPPAFALAAATGHGGAFPWFLGLLPLAAIRGGGDNESSSSSPTTPIAPPIVTPPVVTPPVVIPPVVTPPTGGGGTTPGTPGTPVTPPVVTPPIIIPPIGPQPVPEPGTILLGAGFAIAGFAARRRSARRLK